MIKKKPSVNKYRLVTRADFDGLVCASLLKELGLIEDILFVHPKDMQDGKIKITGRDITANLPYVEGAYLVFDHHRSEVARVKKKSENYIFNPNAPSTARIVYDYYGGKNAFPQIQEEMILAVDKADTANFLTDEVLNPSGWTLLSFLMDSRTGLGRFGDFDTSNFQFMKDLIDYCRKYTIDQILKLPDVKQRVDFYFRFQDKFIRQIKRCSVLYANVLVINLKEEKTIYPGNRFLKYTLFPRCNVSIMIIWGLKRRNTVFTVGKSIFNKTCDKNLGEILSAYGGGGHSNAGTLQLPHEKEEEILNELIEKLKT
ncbi:MAG: exopolyphosphatase [Spirochaetes bacterium]|nr:MAG: exopolyphosphatase [Spirochaetota bacterium]